MYHEGYDRCCAEAEPTDNMFYPREVPRSFICPVSLGVMHNPVTIDCECQCTMDKAAAVRIARCPLCRAHVRQSELRHNLCMKRTIEELKHELPHEDQLMLEIGDPYNPIRLEDCDSMRDALARLRPLTHKKFRMEPWNSVHIATALMDVLRHQLELNVIVNTMRDNAKNTSHMFDKTIQDMCECQDVSEEPFFEAITRARNNTRRLREIEEAED